MKILYRQLDAAATPFDSIGVKECCFKHLSVARDYKRITARAHRHNGFELHILENGHQIYEIDGAEYRLEAGDFLLIPPKIEHRAVESASTASKYALTFSACRQSSVAFLRHAVCGRIDERTEASARLALSEWERGSSTSSLLVSGAVFEIAVRLLRACGMTEAQEKSIDRGEDLRLSMAKQYIADNADHPLRVSEVAAYCYVSERQLTRIFSSEGCTPAEYIRLQRFAVARRLLREGRLTVKEIGDNMGFSSEQYFNSFFKNASGMTPGEYKRMNNEVG